MAMGIVVGPGGGLWGKGRFRGGGMVEGEEGLRNGAGLSEGKNPGGNGGGLGAAIGGGNSKLEFIGGPGGVTPAGMRTELTPCLRENVAFDFQCRWHACFCHIFLHTFRPTYREHN